MPRQPFGRFAARRRRTAMVRNTGPEGGERPLPALEDVIIALQKSLARSQRDARERSRAESGFVTGDQPLYVVDAIDVNLSVALTPDIEERTGAVERMLVDFEAPPEARSSLKLRVESRPLEAMDESDGRLLLADLDPERRMLPRRRFMVSWIGRGRLEAGSTLFVVSTGEMAERIHFQLNALGQATIMIDPIQNSFSLGENKAAMFGQLRLHEATEFFVWAEALLAAESSGSKPTTVQSRTFQTLGSDDDSVLQ